MTNCKGCLEPLVEEELDVFGYHVKCAIKSGIILNWTVELKKEKKK